MTEIERRALVALWSFQGVGPKSVAVLAQRVPMAEWFSLPLQQLAVLMDANEPVAAALRECGSLERRAELLWHRLKDDRQRVCFRGEAAYPPLLVDTPTAPPLLFYRGQGARGSSRGQVAIVGTRRTTKEVLDFTRAFSRDCVDQGLLIASGAAEGVDTAAHEGALTGQGETWAFVASGLDQIDAAPLNIVRRLLTRGGTVFSEYPPGARANEGLFVQRNRLISGAAAVTVVVRGGEQSGARHTAEFAKKQGRRVMAVPAAPGTVGAELCQALLQQGAQVAFDATDVVRALALSALPVSTMRQAAAEEVSATARQLYERMPSGPCDADEVFATSPERSSGALAAALLELELAAWVVVGTGRRYEKRPVKSLRSFVDEAEGAN